MLLLTPTFCTEICDLSRENVPNGYPFKLVLPFTCRSLAVHRPFKKNLHPFARLESSIHKKLQLSVRTACVIRLKKFTSVRTDCAIRSSKRLVLSVQKQFASVRTACVFRSKHKFAFTRSRKSKCMLETTRQNKDVIQYDYVDRYCKVEFHTRILHSYCKAVILLVCCLLFPY